MTETEFYKLTEAPGDLASQEQVERLLHRYNFVREMVEGKKVLEVACGTGIGLRYLANTARHVTGCDIDSRNLERAEEVCCGLQNVTINSAPAEELPHPDESFDVVVLYEAIYYLENPLKFLDESHRVLKSGGRLVIGTVNREWSSFHASPYSHRYFSASELHGMLRASFQDAKFFGAFSTEGEGMRDAIIKVLKKGAVALDLIPKSLQSRAWLKRIFFGKLVPLPAFLDSCDYEFLEPASLSPRKPQPGCKIVYAVATK